MCHPGLDPGSMLACHRRLRSSSAQQRHACPGCVARYGVRRAAVAPLPDALRHTPSWPRAETRYALAAQPLRSDIGASMSTYARPDASLRAAFEPCWSTRACAAGAWALLRDAARARVALRHIGGTRPVVGCHGAGKATRGRGGAGPKN